MIAVADSSPLIILSKLGCLDLLRHLYSYLYISTEVQREVVITGAGLPGSAEVANSQSIQVRQLSNQSALTVAQHKSSLGLGELSAILLAKELNADIVILDDHAARKLAKSEGLEVRGSVGLLETLYLRGHLPNIRSAFQQLITHQVYINRRLLNVRLQSLGLPPL